jgi:hypothetical protein
MKTGVACLLALAPALATAAAAPNSCNLSVDDVVSAVQKAEVMQQTTNVSSMVDEGAKALAALPTSTASGNATAGTLTNFLPLLSVSGLGGALFGSNVIEDDQNLSFEYNQVLGTANAGVLKLKADLARDPVPFSPLVEAVPETDRDGFRTEASDQLDLGDDVTFSLSYSVGQGEYFGKRSIDSYEGVFRNVLGAADTAAYQSAQAEFLTALGEAQELDADITSETSIGEYSIPEGTKRDLCRKAQEFQQQVRVLNAAEELLLERSMFDKLINNSPQLLLSVSLNEKDALAGPDEISGRITFEWGFRTSIGAMEKYAGDCGSTCAAKYFGYISANKDAIEAGDRLKFELEYVDIDDFSYNDVLGDLSFEKPGSEKFVASVAYGRMLPSSALDRSRIDFELKHEDVERDPDRNDRTIGTLTLSRKLEAGGWTVPITIVYSNKPELVQMNSGDRLSAHIGIKWDFERDSPGPE